MSDLNWRGHLAMFGANLTWGLMSPVVKLVLASGAVAPMLLVDFRMAGAAVLFWITSLFMPREHVPARDKLLLCGAGMLGILFNQGCFILGVSMTTPSEASLVTTTMPMWVMLLAWIILREPISLKKAGGIAIGALGALILMLGSPVQGSGASNPVLGDIIVLMAQLCFALYLTLYRNFIRRYSLVTLMKWMFLAASVLSLPLSIPVVTATDWNMIGPVEGIGIVAVVLFATYLAYIFVMTGQKLLRPTVVGIYNYLQPIVATAVGVSLGMDSFTLPKGIAVALIFTGVWLVTTSRSLESDRAAK
ncbi:MAG: DMT family transporter [Muribaculaceae bacterium]|nr:DMT family transporter [Muribaculaceae bacterium]